MFSLSAGPRPVVLFAIVAMLMAVTAASCGRLDIGDDDADALPGPTITRAPSEGESRTIKLGLGAVPADSSADAYIESFATAAQYGEVVLIRRTPPWAEFMPGGNISQETEGTTRLERSLLAQYEPLQLFYAIDLTDPRVQRSRPFGLPASVDPSAPFADPAVREALIAYVTYVVRNYEPEYLAIGAEVNMTASRSPELFNQYVTLYAAAYDAAKQANPETKVFPTFQLEDLLGVFDSVHPPQWGLLDQFAGRMDALAVTTYPYVEFESASRIPESYYAQLREQWDGDIIIAEAGYPSKPVPGDPVAGTPADQDAYVTRLLLTAQNNDFDLVVWFAPLDPATASDATTSVFSDIGLRERNGANKPAWATWETWSRRPLVEPDEQTPEATGTEVGTGE
jgi:hypothetical protein